MMATNNPWTEGTEAMMKSWTDAQKLMMTSWADMARATSQSAPSTNGNANPFADVMQEWQRMAQTMAQGMWGQTDTTTPFTRNVASQMMASQNSMMKMMELTTEAWQQMMPQMQGEMSSGNWQNTLADYTKQVQEQMLSAPTSLMNTSKDANELWALYLKEWQKFGQLQFPVMGGMEAMQSMISGDSPMMNSTMTEGLDRFWNAYDNTLGRAVNAPTLGYSREFNAKVLKGFDAWTKLRRAEASYQIVMGQLWVRAFDSLMKTLVERTQQGEMPSNSKELVKLWVTTADDVFVEKFKEEEYIEAQGDLLNATMSYRIRERALMEAFLDAYGLPTRTELDEAYETIHELRREVRSLRGLHKEVEALKEAQSDTSNDDLETLKEELAELRKTLTDVPKDALEENLPLENYQSLAIGDIEKELDNLTEYELEQVRAFEVLHKNRKTLMSELDRRREERA